MKSVLFAFLTFLAALALLHGTSLSADTVLLPEMVVSARGYGVEASSTPGAVEVLEAEELRELGVQSLPDALDRLPGVDRSSDSPWGPELVIRGLASDSVVLLIDGCRVNSANDLNGRFGLVNPEDIERVEVLKGPVSTLYGTGSTGGVVNVITRKGTYQDDLALHGEVATVAQSNPQGADLYGNLACSLPRSWFFASGGWRDHDSYYSGGHRTPNSQFHDTSAKISAGFRWSDSSQSELQYQHFDGSEIGVPGTGSAPLPTAADVTLEANNRRLLQFRHVIEPGSGSFEQSELMAFYQLIDREPIIDNFLSGQVKSISPEAEHETVGGRWTNILDLAGHRLVLGADLWSWRMSGSRERRLVSGTVLVDDPTPNTTQSSCGVFAEDDWGLSDDWTLNLGARLDYVTIDHGNKILANLPAIEAGVRTDLAPGAHAGITWDAGEAWTFTGLLASSYRTPNTLELFKDINLAGGLREVGNPDLDPERSFFAELGAHYADERLLSDASLFVNRIEDYIASERIDESLYRMSNVSTAELWGIEESVQWNFAKSWTAYGSLAYAEGRDASSGEWLRFVAPFNGLAGVGQRLENGFWWEFEVRFAASQDKTPDDVESSDAWAILNARAGYGFDFLGLRNDLTLGLENILDDRHHNYLATSRGVELDDPGFNALLSWRIRF